MDRRLFVPREGSVWAPLAGTVAIIAAIGMVDYMTGVEYRIFPLYFLPLSVLAWHMGRTGAIAATVLCTVSWLVSNAAAGRGIPSLPVWIINTLMQMVAFLAVGALIAEVRKGYEREKSLARCDPLTGLLNGRAFSEEAERVLSVSRRYGRPLTIGYIDLDEFKRVNDTLGHQAGDDVLRRAADILSAGIRSGDILGRLGGDEFCLVLPETGPSGASALLERLRMDIVDGLGTGPCPISCSVGAVSCITPAGGFEDMLRTADLVMYRAKSEGKNRVRVEVFGRGATGRAGPDGGGSESSDRVRMQPPLAPAL